MTSTARRVLASAAFLLLAMPSAQAQQPLPPPQPQQADSVCTRLEGQLAAFDRGAADPARAEQIRRFEEAANRQQAELDRQSENSRRLGCESNSFFVLFSRQPAQCGPLTAQIQQMRANLDRMNSDLARLRDAGGPEREEQRRTIVLALAQNNCGAQYRAAAANAQPRGGLFESLFGTRSNVFTPGDAPAGSGETYRTLCVRTCDGSYYPVSFSTTPANFANDEKACQRLCPATEVILFSHRNPGEDVNQAVSVNTQQLYTSLPNAFRFRQSFDASCSCRRPGESWAQTLQNLDDTVEQGDIVVNEQRARQLSQPRVDAQGKPIRQEPARPQARPTAATARPATPPPTPGAQAGSDSPDEPSKPDPNRTVRSVGPTFIQR